MNIVRTFTGRKRNGAADRALQYASIAGGSALVAYGLRRQSISGYLLALAGGDLVYRGAVGNGHLSDLVLRKKIDTDEELPYGHGIKLQESVVVDKPAQQLYQFWHDFENLPLFMRHIESIEVQSKKRSQWRVKGPLGRIFEWEAEVIADRPDEMIGWRSLEGSQVDHAGSVRFEPLYGESTKVTVSLQYNPPAGTAGAIIGKLLGANPRRHIKEELRRFKQLMEAADVPVLQRLLQKRA
jgi:uncharacterized membrane protein